VRGLVTADDQRRPSWLCLRWVYGLPAGQRKGFALDEVHFLEQLSSGRLMLTEFARNTTAVRS
jgi:hypothetical protein